ncbi:MAG: cobalt-precorrin 5A hydrolase [Fusobacterium sp.]|nr:cobalt-precorrin 5A hydrolase [Fusobacterium sp.]
MRLAIWSVTRGAGKLAKVYGRILETQVYTLKKFQIEDTFQMENFTETLEKEFNSYDGHIFIMATGIVIRKISTLIKSKDIDPAVVVIDEGANFVISLLSGHLGGANELANIIGNRLNLVPIITTSSDVTGKIAVDTLSQKLNGELESLEKAKNVTSLIVDGKNVELKLPKNVFLENKERCAEGVIIVSNREKLETIQIYPKNLILGVGCKRGTSKEHILAGIKLAMSNHNLSMKSIKKISTVDIKADEIGLIECCKELNKELVIISREDIKKVESQFKGSDFVKKQIGVSCVSEPCALLASKGNGKFLEQKYVYDGMTISIYEEKIYDE